MVLMVIWATPLLSATVIGCSKNNNQMSVWSLFFSTLIFMLIFSFWFLLDFNSTMFYFTEGVSCWTYSGFSVNLSFGMDGLSLLFITLSTFLTPVCLFSSFSLNFTANKMFSVIYFLLVFSLIGSFISLNLFLFFIFFESIVPLMFMIIGVFGSSMQKISASYYFFIYTMLGSMLMLVSMIWILVSFNSLNYHDLVWVSIPENNQIWLWLAFFLTLAAKLPLMPFHIWLPQAHVEAPVSGSVLLAGILLKLGGYGFLSFVFPLFPEANHFFSPLVLTLSLLSLFFAAMTALSQTDFKSLIAYSSVSHMAMVTLGLFSPSVVGVSGSIMLMLAHGFSSSGLFVAISLLYNSHKTSSISYFSGLTFTMPLFSLVFLLFTLSNLALPLTMNFLGELLVLLGIFNCYPVTGTMANLSVIFSAAYSLYLLNSLLFGSESVYITNLNSDLTSSEFYSLFPLLIPLIVFGMNSNYISLIQPCALKSLFW